MTHGVFHIPTPVNEPVKAYAPGSPERASIKARLASMAAEQIEVPLIINGEEIRTGRTVDMVMPHDHGHVLGKFHKASPAEVAMAIEAAEEARAAWGSMAWEERAAIFLRAAALLEQPHHLAPEIARAAREVDHGRLARRGGVGDGGHRVGVCGVGGASPPPSIGSLSSPRVDLHGVSACVSASSPALPAAAAILALRPRRRVQNTRPRRFLLLSS